SGAIETNNLCLRSSGSKSLRLSVAAAVVVSILAGCEGAKPARPSFRWGADREGGGPYIYPDPKAPSHYIGFEVDLANALGKQMDREAQLVLCGWDQILMNLGRRDIDLALNGYEYTPQRARDYASSIPYYIYELGLCVRKGSPIDSWAALHQPASGHRPRVGVLRASSADRYVTAEFGDSCEVVRFEGVVETFKLVESGQLDASVQDLPPIVFYLDRLKRYPKLEVVDRPAQPGYYVLYARLTDEKLIDAVNVALRKLYADGTLRSIYQKYGLWNATQEGLPEVWDHWPPKDETPEAGPLAVVLGELHLFLRAAGVTVLLAVLSMPLAVAIGLAVALVRAWPSPVLGGTGAPSTIPGRFLRGAMTLYVEIIRGTPLVFQLFVIYFVLPDFGVTISAFEAGVLALAVNYSAYEAEIMRLGIQSIPVGQMEAALSLGMTRGLAIRRIILPQAVRTVIPATANDFIALYKDTAVCSVIAVEELSTQYSVAAKSTGLFLHMAVVASILYLAMSWPLSLLAGWLERRLNGNTIL
ncbi:MAG TPA: ABC transporter substrate-binding protein/permease, partial [Planctomycetaceae bacterium]|nr:ABC transporter substrate-binding protein/permease [Planctomycetaceae bacterium]